VKKSIAPLLQKFGALPAWPIVRLVPVIGSGFRSPAAAPGLRLVWVFRELVGPKKYPCPGAYANMFKCAPDLFGVSLDLDYHFFIILMIAICSKIGVSSKSPTASVVTI